MIERAQLFEISSSTQLLKQTVVTKAADERVAPKSDANLRVALQINLSEVELAEIDDVAQISAVRHASSTRSDLAVANGAHGLFVGCPCHLNHRGPIVSGLPQWAERPRRWKTRALTIRSVSISPPLRCLFAMST